MGLVSDGGVHSSLEHLKKLCDVSKEFGIQKTFVHCFMDGRIRTLRVDWDLSGN